jgi:hypothetical protein
MGEADMLAFFADITPQLITYGSRGVIRAWNNFRRVSRNNPDTKTIMFAFEDLLKAMRSDLGHVVITQPQGELLAIFITDIDDILKPKKE